MKVPSRERVQVAAMSVATVALAVYAFAAPYTQGH